MTQRKLAGELDSLLAKLPGAGEHAGRSLNDAAEAIASAGFFQMFSPSYKSAWALITSDLRGDGKTSRPDADAALRDYAAWTDRRDTFGDDARAKSCLVDMFTGWTSDPAALDSLGTFQETAACISKGDERLRYAIETGSLDPLRAFCADLNMPAVTLIRLSHDLEKATSIVNAMQTDRQGTRCDLCLSKP